MNRTQFVDGMFPNAGHFNGMQTAVEQADGHLATALAGCGVVAGFSVSIVGDTATIAPGAAFDASGRFVSSATPLTLDLSGIARPTSGSYRWLTLYVEFSTSSHGDVYDVNNDRHDLYEDEAAAVDYAVGSEDTETAAIPPDVGDAIVLCDILLDAGSAVSALPQSTTRRESVRSVVALKNRTTRVRTVIETAEDKTIAFSTVGLPDGAYSVLAQPASTNNRFLRSLAVSVATDQVTLRLYHDTYPYRTPSMGAPAIAVGGTDIGMFTVGGREAITVDLFIRKEDL